jgi:hypothetical protein
MSSNVANQVAFLRTSREFPTEPDVLKIELNKAYIDIANVVNSRTIGLFPVNRPAQNGESYFIRNNLRQQGFRQVYTFTTTAPIPHNLNLTQIDYFTSNFGEFTDGTNWYGLNPGSNVAIAGQITFYLTPTNITFLTGAGAPALTKGIIVLSWISQP